LELGMATLQRLGHRQTNRLFLRRRHVMPDHPGTAVDHQHGCHGGMAHAGNSERKGNGNQGATIRLHDGNLQGNTASISTRREDSDILRQTHDSAAASCRPELVETAAAIIWNSVSVYGFATGNLPVATLEQHNHNKHIEHLITNPLLMAASRSTVKRAAPSPAATQQPTLGVTS